MSFGKYRGKHVSELPTDYLLWLRDKCEYDRHRWYYGVCIELERRSKQYTQAQPSPSAGSTPALGRDRLLEIIGQWFRELAVKWHPDRGGSTQAMQAINDAHDRLKQKLVEALK